MNDEKKAYLWDGKSSDSEWIFGEKIRTSNWAWGGGRVKCAVRGRESYNEPSPRKILLEIEKYFISYLALLNSKFSPLSLGHCSLFWQAAEKKTVRITSISYSENIPNPIFRYMNMSVLKLLVGIFIWIIWCVLIRHSLFVDFLEKSNFRFGGRSAKVPVFSIKIKERRNIESQSARARSFEIKEENQRLFSFLYFIGIRLFGRRLSVVLRI